MIWSLLFSSLQLPKKKLVSKSTSTADDKPKTTTGDTKPHNLFVGGVKPRYTPEEILIQKLIKIPHHMKVPADPLKVTIDEADKCVERLWIWVDLTIIRRFGRELLELDSCELNLSDSLMDPVIQSYLRRLDYAPAQKYVSIRSLLYIYAYTEIQGYGGQAHWRATNSSYLWPHPGWNHSTYEWRWLPVRISSYHYLNTTHMSLGLLSVPSSHHGGVLASSTWPLPIFPTWSMGPLLLITSPRSSPRRPALPCPAVRSW